MSTIDDMIIAAEDAAGADWGKIEKDVTTFAKSILVDGANIAAKVATGELSDDEAKDLYQMLGDVGDMVKNYAETALLKVLQDAANAAIDVLIAAAKAGTIAL